ncbi:MAG: DUF1493 family protein [Leclercia sp.]
MEPTLSQVIETIRESFGPYRKPIGGNSRIEEDLDICGDDGNELLEACEQAFNISFNTFIMQIRFPSILKMTTMSS